MELEQDPLTSLFNPGIFTALFRFKQDFSAPVKTQNCKIKNYGKNIL